MLGSSGECLPVNRSLNLATTKADSAGSIYSSCDSGSEDEGEFLSARGSFDNNNGEATTTSSPFDNNNGPTASVIPAATDNNNKCHDYARKYAMEMNELETRFTFAEKLRAALSQSLSGDSVDYTASTDDDDDDNVGDGNGSTGFVLREDSLDVDDCFSELARMREKSWLVRHTDNGLINSAGLKTSMSSSSYSFSTDYSSELEEVYEQFAK